MKAEEAPRGFAVFIQQVDDGSVHAELSEAIQTVVSSLSDQVEATNQDAKGELTLVLKIHGRRNRTFEVQAEVKTKTPKPKRAAALFWGTKGGNLVAENPRQTKLPLREVPNDNKAPIDVGSTSADARSV